MADDVRLGIVGLRNIGQGHLRAALAVPDCSVSAYADTDAGRLRDVCAKFGPAQTYTNAQELFDSANVDAVVLAVPNFLHAPLTIAALRAGKHVLVEKPMSRTTAEARDMIAERDRAGKVLMIGMNQRFSAPHLSLRELVRSGALGEIYYGRTRWCQQRPYGGIWERGEWCLSAEKSGGGALIDMGVHRLDLALHLMGFPRVASVNAATFNKLANIEAARRGRGPFQVDDAGVALIRFTNGAALVLEASYFLNCPRREALKTLLCGTRGYLEAADQSSAYHVDNDEQPLTLPMVNGSNTCVEHFVRVIRGEEELSPTAEQGLASMEILDAIYESARTGENVNLRDPAASAK